MRFKENIQYYILVIVLIISAFFFFYNLDSTPPGLYIDEAVNGLDAQSGVFHILYPDNGGREGLFIILQSLVLSLVGIVEPWVLRMVSGIVGIIGIIGLFYFISSLFSHIAPKHRYLWAGIGAYITVGTLWYSILSRVGFRALLASTILIWTLLLLKKAFDDERLSLFLFAGLIGGIGMYSYTAYYISLLIFILFSFVYGRFKKESFSRIVKPLYYFFTSFIVVSIPLFFSLSSLHRIQEVSIFSQDNPFLAGLENFIRTLGMLFIWGDMNARHNIPGLAQLSPLLSICFLVGLFYYLYSLTKKKKKTFLFYLLTFLYGWILIGTLPAVFSSEGIPHALRSVLMIFPSTVGSLVGIYILYTYIKKKVHIRALYIGSTALILIFGISQGYLLFSVWGSSSLTANAFSADVLDTAYTIRTIDTSIPIYVVVYRKTDNLYRGVYLSASPIMFMNPQRDITYLTSDEEESIPKGAAIFYIGEKEE